MKKIATAIIGLGRIGSLLEEDKLREKPCTHAGAFAANADCELAAGCDIDDERRALFAKKWGVPVYKDAAEMLQKHKPQIVSIATDPDMHLHFCSLAAREKVPVIICEKPLADNLKDARKIARLADSGITIITNHERRYALDYIRAKEILTGGELGSVCSIRAVLYMGKNRRLVEQFWHDGTHLADAVMFLTDGELKHKRAWGAKLTSRQGTAWLEGRIKHRITRMNTNEIPIIFEIGAGRDHLVFEIEVSCENGRLRIGNSVFEVYKSAASPYAENFNSLKNTGETFSGATGYFANMIKDAVACVKEPQRQPVSTAADGLKVIEYLNSVSEWR